MCIHSDDEIAPVAYLQLKQLSLVEKKGMVALNQSVHDHSTFYMEKLMNKSSPKAVEGMDAVKIMKILDIFTVEKTSVFHCEPFVWVSIAKYKGGDPAAVAESLLFTMKGCIHIY